MPLCAIRNEEGITVVGLPSQIDHVISIGLELELREAVACVPKAVLCDFSQTSYVSSSGLRVFLLIAKMMEDSGGKFGIYSLSPFVANIFRMSGFSRIIPIYESKAAAVRAVSTQ
jgi:anti-sigma B factor antagonist